MDFKPVHFAVAGTGGSIISMALLYPLDVIRSRLQIETSDKGYAGPLEIIREAAKSPEGIKSLYRGLQPTLTTVGISSGIYFWLYNLFKQYVEAASGHSLTALQNLLVAYVAGAVNATSTCPLWTASQRIKVARKSRPAPTDAEAGAGAEAAPSTGEAPSTVFGMVAKIAQTEGPGSLFTGVPPALLLCSNPAIQFLAYERLKARVLKNARQLSSGQAFILGAVAKAIATVLTYPIQVVQTRTQAHRSNGMVQVARDIWNNEGPGGFFKGIQSKMLQTVLNAAFMFAIFERLLRVVGWLFRVKKKVGAK